MYRSGHLLSIIGHAFISHSESMQYNATDTDKLMESPCPILPPVTFPYDHPEKKNRN